MKLGWNSCLRDQLDRVECVGGSTGEADMQPSEGGHREHQADRNPSHTKVSLSHDRLLESASQH